MITLLHNPHKLLREMNCNSLERLWPRTYFVNSDEQLDFIKNWHFLIDKLIMLMFFKIRNR